MGDKHAALSILVGLVVEIFWFMGHQLIYCPLSLYILKFCAWILFFFSSQVIEISTKNEAKFSIFRKTKSALEELT